MVELLVTVAVTALMASLIIVYGSASRQQVTLSIETAKLGQIISQAKSMSISTYNQTPAPCGYGVHIDYNAQKYYLGSYQVLPDCKSVVSGAAFQMGWTVVLKSYALAAEVRFSYLTATNSVDDVFFVPPDPKTVTSVSGLLSTQASGNVFLVTKDGAVTKKISINPVGQINF